MSDDRTAFPRLHLEAVDPWVLGLTVGVDGLELSDLVLRCMTELGTYAPRPQEIALVITGNFDDSVRARYAEVGSPASFTSKRGAGTVAGKTMVLRPDKIDILMPAWGFFDSAAIGFEETDEQRHQRHWLTLRTIIHEAQHAAMAQRSEGNDHRHIGLVRGLAKLQFARLAGESIDEYRAELVAERTLQHAPDDDRGISDALLHHRQSLVSAYRLRANGGSVDEFLDASLTSSNVLWKVLAYYAATLRATDRTAPDPSVVENELWQRYVEPEWAELSDLLGQIPPGDQNCDLRFLDKSLVAYANLLQSSFRTFGFEFYDTSEGTRLDFLESAHDHL